MLNRREVLHMMAASGALLAIGGRRNLGSAHEAAAAGELLIRGGRIVNVDGSCNADVRIVGESVAELGANLRPGVGARVIDVSGKLVLPGGIDPHVHLAPGYGIDDLTVGSMAALAGGISTIGTFAWANETESLEQAIDVWAGRVRSQAIADVFLHADKWPFTDAVVASLAAIVAKGQPSFKILIPEHDDFGAQLPSVIRFLEAARKAGVLTLVHCEDPAIIGSATRRLVEAGRTSLDNYAASRPEGAEIATTAEMAALCEHTGAPVYVVHISSARALDACRQSRQSGARLYTETRPLYLHFTDAKLSGPDARLFIGQPPLRKEADRDALWRGLADGTIDVLGSDHAPSTRAEKLAQALSITNTLPGISDLQFMLPMYYSEGVRKRGIPLERFVATTSTNTARIFGLYPRKGVIRVGSDADIVIWDPTLTRTVTADADLSNADYSVYDGWSVTGWPITTIRRGAMVFDGGKVLGGSGTGQLLPRAPWTE